MQQHLQSHCPQFKKQEYIRSDVPRKPLLFQEVLPHKITSSETIKTQCYIVNPDVLSLLQSLYWIIRNHGTHRDPCCSLESVLLSCPSTHHSDQIIYFWCYIISVWLLKTEKYIKNAIYSNTRSFVNPFVIFCISA